MSQNGRRNVRRVVHDAYYDEYRRDASFELIFEVLLRNEIIKWPTKNVCFSCLGLLIDLRCMKLTGSHNPCFEMLRALINASHRIVNVATASPRIHANGIFITFTAEW